jgi:nicotinamide-nucleotide amidase
LIKASIITIGDELLIGQVIDTNSAFIAQQLNANGFAVNRRVAVADEAAAIEQALTEEAKQSKIIIITGGLGPTADDITKPLLCKYFGGKLIVNQTALENVQYIFEHIIKRPLTERNIKQAEVPDVCTILQNKNGTAPGMVFFKDGVCFVSMPGVPAEMKNMMEHDVISLLKKEFKPQPIMHRTLLLAGIGESTVADLLVHFEAALPTYIKLAYLPNYGFLRLRLTGSHTNEQELLAKIESAFADLQFLVKENLVATNDEPLEKIIFELLDSKKLTLSTAESCTGGFIAHLITAQAGASSFFEGGVVCYSNQVKKDILQVQETALQQNGAVSEAVVIQMAEGALQQFKTDYSLSVSGIMGPGGGTAEKPVGLVWICAANQQKHLTLKLNLRFNRETNIKLSAMHALNLLRTLMAQ